MFTRTSLLVSAVLCLVGATAFAQPRSVEPSTLVLFENVRIFNGKSDTLSEAMNVLVRGNAIDKISRDPIPTDRRADTRIIAGGGRTLMPGLIDMHWHTMLVRPTERPRGLPAAVRGATRPRCPAVSRGADGCCHDRGQS
jgi:hypothetical protein